MNFGFENCLAMTYTWWKAIIVTYPCHISSHKTAEQSIQYEVFGRWALSTYRTVGQVTAEIYDNFSKVPPDSIELFGQLEPNNLRDQLFSLVRTRKSSHFPTLQTLNNESGTLIKLFCSDILSPQPIAEDPSYRTGSLSSSGKRHPTPRPRMMRKPSTLLAAPEVRQTPSRKQLPGQIKLPPDNISRDFVSKLYYVYMKLLSFIL